MKKRPPRSFRFVCPPDRIPAVEAFLHAQGYAFETEPFSPFCRRLTEEPRPLGGSLAAFFGYIYIQDRSSMLPPLALNPAPGSAVLDMCASPGSKTGFLAQLAGPRGFVLGNEPGKPRLATLRANLQQMNLIHAGTCSFSGESLPLPAASLDAIQLDPPCSGWGTAEKNPLVKKLWHGEKTRPLIRLQRQLLQKAWDLLRPGGIAVYSTCTTNVQENEEQIRYAVEQLGFLVEPLPPFAGFVWEKPGPGGEGTLRVDGEQSGAQGFYIARLRKPGGIYAPFALPPQPAPLPEELPRRVFDNLPCTDPGLLPPGTPAVFNEFVRFIPAPARDLLPPAFAWQGALLGKFHGGNISLSPRLRQLMPATPPPEALCLDDLSEIQSLFTGRSLQTGLPGTETGLYWQNLPLCRIKLKNGRVLAALK